MTPPLSLSKSLSANKTTHEQGHHVCSMSTYSAKAHGKAKSNRRANTLSQLLAECKAIGGKPITHTSFGASPGSYHIPATRQEELYALVAKSVFSCNEDVTLVERIEREDVSPFRVDLDIKYTIDSNNPPAQDQRVYGGGIMDEFLAIMMSCLHECLKVPEDQEKCLLYLFEKSHATEQADGVWKDGVHIMMPHIITSTNVMKNIRKRVIAEMGDMIIDMKESGFNIINDPEDIYDEAVIERSGWMMYGCGKPNRPKYMLTAIWNGKPDDGLHKYTESEADHAPDNVRKQLMMLFSNRHMKYNAGDNSYAVNFIKQMSIRGHHPHEEIPHTELYDMQCQAENERAQKIEEAKKQQFPWYVPMQEDVDDNNHSNKNFALDLVTKCLNPRRADNYSEWSKLCWCLHNIHNADDRLLEAFIEFSKRSERYSDEAEAACRKYWIKARSTTDNRRKLEMGSLCDWAKEDNPDMYASIMEVRLDRLIKRCCDKYLPKAEPKTDDDGNFVEAGKTKPVSWDNVNWYLVEVLHKQYGYNMVCTSAVSDKTWWEYKNHRWTNVTEGLRNYLSVDVHNLFTHYAQAKLIELNSIPTTNKEMRAEVERIRSAALGIANNTRNPVSKGKIFNESCERFAWNYRSHMKDRKHDKSFEDLLDQNIYLIGLDNGIYDLKDHSFRPGICDDMISRSTENPWYEPENGWDDPVVKDVMTFMKQVLPDKQTRQYVLTLFASFLDGKVMEKFHIFVGCGGNGKSKLIDLVTYAMGQSSGGGGYCGNLPTSALTGKRGCSSGPSPEFVRLRGMRFVVVQEPEPKDRIQPGRLKELTGGDTIQARALHKAPVEFKPQFGIVMASNVLPKVPGDDGGVWRRMRVVRFNSRFRPNPIPDDPNEFPIDEDLTDKLQEWKLTFFWILTRYYKVFIQGDHGEVPILHYEEGETRASKGLPYCKSVELETQRYHTQNDPINHFIVKNVNNKPEDLKHSRVDFDRLWELYKDWCKDQSVEPIQDDLRNAMEIRFDIMEDSPSFRGWKKICLYTSQEKLQMQQDAQKHIDGSDSSVNSTNNADDDSPANNGNSDVEE